MGPEACHYQFRQEKPRFLESGLFLVAVLYPIYFSCRLVMKFLRDQAGSLICDRELSYFFLEIFDITLQFAYIILQ